MTLPILDYPGEIIAPLTPDNAGGIRQLRLIPAQFVALLKPERFPLPTLAGYPDNMVSSQHLTFAPGASLMDVDVRPEYCSFTDIMDTDANGELFRPTIQLIIPKIRPDVVAWVQTYRAIRWLAFLEDRNGYFRMAGTPEQPLSVAATFGQPMGKGSNQTILTFTGAVEQPAYFVTGITDAVLLYVGAFTDAFGFGFDT
ncbi:hypothetical protein GO730_20815 [Spirosoma sp. HMF3257]|uniref:Uncharacterized protein n=1 Tax=Spirosoma telluris TaxID=2183553 RepID=A0A327NKU2_9BACT|nr:hypothetical protein [Spirosoma telluris]RAI75990.1 hypothetical protein HMF3257_20740 [Spirosoma telluris]